MSLLPDHTPLPLQAPRARRPEPVPQAACAWLVHGKGCQRWRESVQCGSDLTASRVVDPRPARPVSGHDGMDARELTEIARRESGQPCGAGVSRGMPSRAGCLSGLAGGLVAVAALAWIALSRDPPARGASSPGAAHDPRRWPGELAPLQACCRPPFRQASPVEMGSPPMRSPAPASSGWRSTPATARPATRATPRPSASRSRTR